MQILLVTHRLRDLGTGLHLSGLSLSFCSMGQLFLLHQGGLEDASWVKPFLVFVPFSG